MFTELIAGLDLKSISGSMPHAALLSLLDSWLVLLSISALSLLWLRRGAPLMAQWRSSSAWRLYSRERTWSWIIVAGVTLIGLWRAWQLMWIGDDAFISLRYSEMFSRGEGLVFNQGEWVEGYTNFLWTWALGLFAKLGAPLPQLAVIGDLLSFVGAVVFVHLISRRVRFGLIPAFVMSSAYPCVVFATSGLETMPAVMCVLMGAYALLRRAPLLGGLAFVAGAMMRPDHLLFWGCGGLTLALTDVMSSSGSLLSRLRWGSYLRFTAPLALIYVPYFLWRMNAYGEVFPNTYYAKSGHLTYWSQGAIYLSSYLLGAGVWWLALSALVLGLLRVKRYLQSRTSAHASIALNPHRELDEIDEAGETEKIGETGETEKTGDTLSITPITIRAERQTEDEEASPEELQREETHEVSQAPRSTESISSESSSELSASQVDINA